jgi:uncharacterized protein YndB with AHSA1/START domain
MTHFRSDIEIQAPPERVFDVMTDVERWPEWTPTVSQARRIDPGPLAVGSRVRIHQPKFPAAVWTVTALEPGRGFTWICTGPGLRVTARHTIEAAGDVSRVTLSLQFEGWLGPIFGRMTRSINERYLGIEARSLKARSEDSATEASRDARGDFRPA